MNDVAVTLLVALLAPASAASPTVESGLTSAARYCEAVVTEKKRAPLLPAGATVHSDRAVPGLIRRFAATRPMIGMFGIESYLHFRARNGQVWVVRSQQADVCSIVVTAVPGGSAALTASFTKSLSGQGWKNRSSLPATGAGLLWRHGFVKWVPKADSPNYGLILDVRGLIPSASPEDGVQMELSFMGGDDLQVSSGPSPR